MDFSLLRKDPHGGYFLAKDYSFIAQICFVHAEGQGISQVEHVISGYCIPSGTHKVVLGDF